MAGVKPGETVRVQGEWKNHLVHGRQFEVKQCKAERPADIVGIKKYLGSGLIKGIGPVNAGRIVEKFGIETLNILDKTPEKLLSIPGLGKKKLDEIVKCWSEQRSIRDVMIFLQSYGVSPAYAQKIFKTYGDQSVKVVTENPYRLARDIFGVGFKSADQIAQKLGILKNSPFRVDAGLEFLLTELGLDGHVCYPEKHFLETAAAMLEVENLAERLNALIDDHRIDRISLVEGGENVPFVWLRNFYMAEQGIASEIKRIEFGKSLLRAIDAKKAIAWAESKLSLQLAENQKQAVEQAVTDKVQIITGGPGTGKSTITKAILAISQELTDRIILAAPTGRAAKRMSEITGKPAKTIHSLLEMNFKQGGFKRNRDNPLEADLIIIDEASMIDTHLMFSLLKAIPSYARLIFVGDVNQLPSVGPGSVLKDMIASRMIPTVTLNEIFRQAAGSRIITNAHRINRGDIPELKTAADSDFFFIEEENPEKIVTHIRALVKARLPQKYGFHPLHDIQVLAPMRKGVIGTENLNHTLQEELNPRQDHIFRSGRKFCVNDKVMQIRNNYNKEVYNGDIGYIQSLDVEDGQLLVKFDEREIVYEVSELDELVPAYAVSIHKYQGSEAPCIIIPIHTSHFKLLNRNLFYTGVTRGKKLVVVIGNMRGIVLAVKNDEVLKRYSGLQTFLLNNV
jgi:exodeoxyribonuclease V alpha subunit